MFRVCLNEYLVFRGNATKFHIKKMSLFSNRKHFEIHSLLILFRWSESEFFGIFVFCALKPLHTYIYIIFKRWGAVKCFFFSTSGFISQYPISHWSRTVRSQNWILIKITWWWSTIWAYLIHTAQVKYINEWNEFKYFLSIVAWKFGNVQTTWFPNLNWHVHKGISIISIHMCLCMPFIGIICFIVMPINWWNIINRNPNYYNFWGNTYSDHILLGIIHANCTLYSNRNSINVTLYQIKGISNCGHRADCGIM